MIVTSVSTCGLQRQSNKGKLSSNEVVKSPRLQIEHMNSHDKTIQTRTFLDTVRSHTGQAVQRLFESAD